MKRKMPCIVHEYWLEAGCDRSAARRRAARMLRGVARRALKMARGLGPDELLAKRNRLMKLAITTGRMARSI